MNASSKSNPPDYAPGVFEGHYFATFEVSDFAPLGSDEHWWLSGDVCRQLATLMRSKEAPNPCYLKVEGRLSEKGRWGHLGQYERELIASKLVAYGPVDDAGA